MSEGKKSMGVGKMAGIGCVVVLGLVVLLVVIGAIAGDGKNKDGTVPVAMSTADQQQEVEAEKAEEEPANILTGPQNNAARSAAQYLSMSGFSRGGLIAQLSSDAGDGYAIGDATAAVDSLDVDWNEEAAKSAKQYLSISGFSCKGLIEQLSSSAGDKYTVSQATYGAKEAGAC